jgi:hypothetical protein
MIGEKASLNVFFRIELGQSSSAGIVCFRKLRKAVDKAGDAGGETWSRIAQVESRNVGVAWKGTEQRR